MRSAVLTIQQFAICKTSSIKIRCPAQIGLFLPVLNMFKLSDMRRKWLQPLDGVAKLSCPSSFFVRPQLRQGCIAFYCLLHCHHNVSHCSDHYTPEGRPINMSGPWPTDFDNSYQPRWDSWGRLTQAAFSSRLLMGLHGNHEVGKISHFSALPALKPLIRETP